MRKNYFLSFLVLVFGLCFSFIASAQLHASDDSGTAVNTSATSIVIPNLLANDTFNNLPVTLSQVAFISMSPTSNNFSIDSNAALVFSGGPVPAGTYSFQYQLCTAIPSFECAFAMIYVNVGCVPIDAPVVTNVVQPTCGNPTGSISLSWVGTRILMYSVNGIAYSTVTGNGGVTIPTLPGTSGPMIYDFYLSGNPASSECNSPHVVVTIAPISGLDLDMQGTYVDFNANGITDVGDIINYQFTVTNYSCNTVSNIIAGPNTTLPILGAIASLAPGASDSTSLTATYVLTQNDVNTGYVTKYVSVYSGATPTSIFAQASATTILNMNDGIRLVAFVDTNENGIKDLGEPNFNSGSFNYEMNNNGTVHHIVSNQDFYLFETNATNTYDLSYTVNTPAYYSSSASYNDITIANGSGITTYYFPIIAIPYTDLSVGLYNYGAAPRPGFAYTNWLYYRNNGNQPIASGTVTFIKDSALTITNISQSGTTTTANGFTYNFINLLPGESRYIDITMLVPTIPTVALGQTVTNTASVTIPAGDVDTNNNTTSLSRTIVGSWDPNEKSESHGGRILYSGFTADDYLTYTIQFENTGTADAINVRVTDVLDAKLDETSVRMINSSHAYTLDRIGNTLTWNFDGIDLPPSVPNTTTGHGFVVFQVKPKPGFVLGDVIPNIANIYFDFNPAIETNPCVTQFVNSLATDQFALDNFKYYPNPVKNVLTVSNDAAIDSAVISSVLGQQVLVKNVNALKGEIDLSGLSNGVYFVKVSSGGQVKTIKIIKE